MSPQLRAKQSILLVDDHTLFREGLKSLLSDSALFAVAGEAGSVAEACRQTDELLPDIVLMDISLPDRSGLEGARLIQQQHPAIKLVVISMHSKREYILEALRAGAVGFLVKDGTPDMLLRALESVVRGYYYFDPTALEEMVHCLLERQETAAAPTETKYDRLTRREQEVMRCVAEGLTTRQIAERLCISPKTVENHRTKIMVKLEFENVVDLVKYAARLGIINIPA